LRRKNIFAIHFAPPETVSKTDKAVKNQYSADFEELKVVTALLNNDIELQNDLKLEYADLMSEYKKESEELQRRKNEV